MKVSHRSRLGGVFAHWAELLLQFLHSRVPSAHIGNLQSFDYGNVCLLMEMIQLSVQGVGFEFSLKKQMRCRFSSG